MQGQRHVDLGEDRQVPTFGAPNGQALLERWLELAPHRLTQRVDLLLSEAEAEPRIQRLCVRRGRDHKMVRPLLVRDPDPGGSGIGLANCLHVRAATPRVLDPHVRAPCLVRSWSAQHVGDCSSVQRDDRSGRIRLLEQRGNLLTSRGGELESTIESEDLPPLMAVALGEEPACLVEIIGAERADFVASHRRAS